MFAGLSFGGVIIALVLIYMLRGNLQQLNEQLPEAISNITSSAVKATKALDTTVTVNCLEHGAELTARAQEAMQLINELGGVADFDALYNQVYNVKPKKRNLTAVPTNSVNP